MVKTKEKEKSFNSINLQSFILVTSLLLGLLIIAGLLSYLIPQGAYETVKETGEIIPGTFKKGRVEGIAFWRVLTAPVRVFGGEDSLTIIMICVFLLVMSGIFNIMEKTGGVRVLIRRLLTKFSNNKKTVLCATILLFMAFGSFFGMFEELVTLLPIIIVFALSLGYDTMTGVGVCMLAACFGFSAAITNPFSVGLATEAAETGVLDGIWLRIVFFVLIYGLLCGFILLHARRIKKNPEKSLTYEMDKKKRETLKIDEVWTERDGKIYRVYGIFFLAQFVVLIAIASIRAISGFAIPILAASFLIGGILSGLLVSEDKAKVWTDFFKGALGMLPAVLMIAIASSVKLVLDESGILHTIMHAVISALDGKSKFVCVLLVYLLILFLQIFIGSSSAKIMLVMPIIVPISTALGISPATIILTYCIADGFTDMLLPTNPVLLIGLSMAGVSYAKWIRWTWLLQVVVFVLTVAMLMFAVSIGY